MLVLRKTPLLPFEPRPILDAQIGTGSSRLLPRSIPILTLEWYVHLSKLSATVFQHIRSSIVVLLFCLNNFTRCATSTQTPRGLDISMGRVRHALLDIIGSLLTKQ